MGKAVDFRARGCRITHETSRNLRFTFTYRRSADLTNGPQWAHRRSSSPNATRKPACASDAQCHARGVQKTF